MTDNPLLKAALEYARRGWPVFPLHTPHPESRCSCGKPNCEHQGKHPRTRHGLKDASTDPRTIRQWWEHWPDANIGIRTGKESGLVVVDFDVGHVAGVNGIETAKVRFGFTPHSHFVRTGAGGVHCYFKRPKIPALKSRTGHSAIAPGVELKADGGYVVASPSLHSSGTRYEWLSSAVTDGELPDLPAWALNGAVAASVKATSSAKTGCGDVIHGGARNNTLASLAGTMKRRNMSPESIEAALLKENAVRCLPPLAESEVRKIAVSIGRYPVGPGAQLKSSDAKIAELAALPPDEYDRQRDAAAKELRVRKSTLDKLVQARHPLADSGTGQGTPLELEEPVPWPAPVDGRTLLNELVGGFTRYVVLPPHGATALALWTVFAHSLDCFAVAPRLALLSPEKRCGKTLTLTLLSFLVPRALLASSISLASLFRTVDKARPTLLLDEADTFVHMSDELRGVLNSGHSRAGAFVIRVVGDNFEPRKFSTWAAMAFGAIGRLPDALMDRSIIMLMVRKAPGETVRRFRQDRTEDLQVLARKAARWAADNAEALKGADPGIPGGLNDRAADNWRPLLAIADLSGGEWPDRARVAAVQLSAAGVVEDPSVRVRLLEDLRDMFSRARADRLTSADICDKLAAMEDRPWPEYRHGLPITPTQLAKLLKPFNITPSTIRIGKNVAKGYALSAMQDTFKRFSGAEAVTPLQPSRTEEDLTSSRGNILENVTPGGASKRLENTGLLRRNGSAIP